MSRHEHLETLQLIADHLEIELDDLEFVDRTATSCTFLQRSTGETRTAEIAVGPEGPVVSVVDSAP